MFGKLWELFPSLGTVSFKTSGQERRNPWSVSHWLVRHRFALRSLEPLESTENSPVSCFSVRSHIHDSR